MYVCNVCMYVCMYVCIYIYITHTHLIVYIASTSQSYRENKVRNDFPILEVPFCSIGVLLSIGKSSQPRLKDLSSSCPTMLLDRNPDAMDKKAKDFLALWVYMIDYIWLHLTYI